MNKSEIYKTIDRELEKWVFLMNAEEGNHGIYELIYELGHYEFLDIADKYLVALDLLTELLLHDMLVLEEFESPDFKIKNGTIDSWNYWNVLNNPASWYPSGQPYYTINIMQKGIDLLDKLNEQDKRRLNERLEIE